MKFKIGKKYFIFVLVFVFGLVVYWRFIAQSPCVLNVLTPGAAGQFNGYLSALQIGGFHLDGKCSVQTSTYRSTEELLAKLRATAGSYDLIIATGEAATPLITNKLVREIDLKKAQSLLGVYLPLRELQVVRVNSEVFGIPLDWTPVGLIYDSSVVKTPPSSWNDLWRPQYRGQVAISDDSFGYLSAVEALGFVRPGSSAPYFLSDDQILKIKEKLLQLKPQLKALTSRATESNPRQLAQLFGKHEVVLAIGSPWEAKLLERTFPSVKSAIPHEGGMARIDFIMFPAQIKNLEKAYSLANLLLQGEEQKRLTRETGSESPGLGVPIVPPPGERKGRASVPHDIKPTREFFVDREKDLSHFFFVQNPSGRHSLSQLWSDIRGALLSQK